MDEVTYNPVPSTLKNDVRGYERWNVINTCVQRDDSPKHRKRPCILLCTGRGPEGWGVCQMEWVEGWWRGVGGDGGSKEDVHLSLRVFHKVTVSAWIGESSGVLRAWIVLSVMPQQTIRTNGRTKEKKKQRHRRDDKKNKLMRSRWRNTHKRRMGSWMRIREGRGRE